MKDLMQAHRLVRSLLQGEILDLYGLLDFVIWPQGLFLRISLKKFSTLSEFLAFLKTQNLYPGHSSEDFWNDDLEWIRVVPPEKLDESTQRFWDQAFQLREELQATKGFDPNLFFFYRKSDL